MREIVGIGRGSTTRFRPLLEARHSPICLSHRVPARALLSPPLPTKASNSHSINSQISHLPSFSSFFRSIIDDSASKSAKYSPPPKKTYLPPPNKAKSSKSKSGKSKSAKGKGAKGAKGGSTTDDGEWSWYTTTAATAMGDDGWSWNAGEHTPTVQPTPCGKAGKECDEEEVEIPTSEPTPCGKAGKECDHGEDGDGMQPPDMGDDDQPIVLPSVDPGMPDDSMTPPTEPVAIVTTDPPPLPETPAPVPDLIPIVKTYPPTPAYPTYAPTSIPTSTLQGIERGGTWFQSGRAYDIEESYYRTRTSELEQMAAVYDREDADDAASGAPRTAAALVGLVAAGLAGLMLS